MRAGDVVDIDGESVEIGPAGDPDALALVVPAEQSDEAEKFEAALVEAQLVGQNVLVIPPSLDVAVGSKPAGDPVSEEIVDRVRACVPG
ncbi:MAG: hypothetical protein EXQ70_05915 [Solirubrobacterales bacterium]|nr:hypothetical protein [Solirubrobacterales bacterium]